LPGSVGSGVDIDAVRSDIRFLGRGVAMHDDFAEILFMQKKSISNPEEVRLLLLPQWNFGADTRMAEEEVATGVRQCQTCKEAAMLVGQRLAEGNG